MIMLTIKDLSFRYNDHYVLKNCNLQVNAGDIVGLIGDNGVGKTTLMKLISGILPDYTGDITVNSETIGVLIENPTLYPNMTVLSNLHFFCNLYNRPQGVIDDYKTILNVESYLNKKVSKLSMGMKQRIGLFVALICSETFILLDEPTNGLDPTGILELLTLIKRLAREKGITFIISSHILQNLEAICTKHILLSHQKITTLDTGKYLRYKIYSFDISQKNLVQLLEKGAFEFEQNKRDIIVSDVVAIESFLKDHHILIEKEKIKLSEVYFDEK